MTSVTDLTRRWAAERAYPITFTERTGSTNDDAKAAAMAQSEHLYLTAHQTAGRGRGANTWVDRGEGKILLSSWITVMHSAPQAITGPRVGLALFRAVTRAWPALELGLKAPNDLFLSGQKVAGLLIEVVSTSGVYRVITGLGLNGLDHPGELATATNLARTLGRAITADEWFDFLDAWVTELRTALVESTAPELSKEARHDLRAALNANRARAFEVQKITPGGDLIHAGGVVSWTAL